MKTTRNLVAAFAKFAAGVKLGQNSFQGRNFGLFMDFHGNASAIIRNFNFTFGQQAHSNIITKTGHGFINAIVHHFPNQMMQAFGGSITNIHTWSFSHRFQAFQNRDLFGRVFSGFLFFFFV